MDIQDFISEFKKTFIYDMLCESLEDEQLFEHVIVGNQVIWMKEQTRQMWSMWQASKASVVEWISIQDKWPERGDPVLLIVNGVVQQVTYFRSYLNADDDWFEPVYFEGDCLPIHDVTHWQQLPELPKAQEPSNEQ